MSRRAAAGEFSTLQIRGAARMTMLTFGGQQSTTANRFTIPDADGVVRVEGRIVECNVHFTVFMLGLNAYVVGTRDLLGTPTVL